MCRVPGRRDTVVGEMTDFLTFYLNGGLFNHLVTIGLAVATSSLVFHARARDQAGIRWLRLADRALLGCVGLGLLGTLLGIIDASAALATIPAEQFMVAQAQAAGLAVIPLAWALVGAIPLGIVASVQAHRHIAT
jgi:hypothetical protein